MAVQRTPEQEAVVKNRGGGLLVSAAAGSGKTRVLVERLLDRIEHEGERIDRFLIITFTRAAAEELRSRIAGELAQALEAQPDNAHLRRQTGLLYQTQISTIHSFCTVLLRQWGHLLDLPADFTLCEDEDAQVLMLRTLNQVLDARYETIDPEGDFAKLLDILSGGRDDSKLIDIALDVYGKIQSAPHPDQWLETQARAFDLSGVTRAEQTPWGALLLEEAERTAAYWVAQMERACALAQEDDSLEKAYGESLRATLGDLRGFVQAAGEGWDQATAAKISFPRLKGARGVEAVDAQEEIKSIRTRCKKAAEELEAQFASDSASLLEDMALVYPAMRGLVDLVKDFSAAYAREKKERGLLDFSDLEHFAVALLVDEEGEPTQLARQWGEQYTEIMVDEYQDTNQVQNTIFRALSRNGENLFMVGDVKQSIYRFRLADPTIFLEKARRFLPWTQASKGQERKITMSRNFRSRPEVLEAANNLFRTILSPELGEMDYTQEEALHPGGTFPPGTGYETALRVLDFSEDPALTEEKQSKHFLEARFVARQIAGLLREGFPVSDGAGGTRPIRPDDVAILLRSPGPVRHFYALALEEEGVTWWSEEGADFFQTTEISVALSWLQILDNPRQDIPLLAVLRSPVCGFTGDHLAEIRAGREGSFYDALCAAAEEGDEDSRRFLEELSALRFGAGEQSSHGLLWALYQKTNLLELFSLMPDGEKRRENLLALYQVARRFEGTGHKGLFRFLLHLDRVRESGGLAGRSAPASQQAGVKILSIHRSKGLEYPVVFLCGLGRRFNYNDLQKPVLFHPKLGLGPKGLDPERMVSFSTLARTGVALALKKEMLAEEMRLLYVAMTRAKEKLVMVHSLSYGVTDLKGLAESVSYPADPRVLAGCSSAGQWILLAAMARPEGAVLRDAAQRGGLPPVAEGIFGPAWAISYHHGAVSQEAAGPVSTSASQETAAADPDRLIETLRWRYPHDAATATPAKVTATQIQGSAEEEAGVFLLRDKTQEGPAPFHRPRFAQERLGLTAAQRGTAVHTAIQGIRMEETASAPSVAQALDRLTREGYLTPQEAQAVSPAMLADFFSGELGRKMRESESLRREFPFSLLAPAERFFSQGTQGETVLLQGVIDCWWEESDGLTLLDFKTDRVPAPYAEERAEKYRGQMEIYAWALEELTGKPVRREILWFLHAGRGVDLLKKQEKNEKN